MDIAHRVEQAIQACHGHAVNFLMVISYYLFPNRPGLGVRLKQV